MSTGKPDPLPGLAAIPFRAGIHGSFRAAMIAGIQRHPALARLKTREPSDPSIALFDAWATTLDVLTFYQERIVNEGYLRPALERRSVLELARATGYELAPGVAAGTYLALTCDNQPGGPEVVPVAAGTRVQSVPGPDETPQLFETAEDVEAQPAFNALAAEAALYRRPRAGDKVLYLDENGAGLGVGDSLLVVGDERRNDPSSGRWLFRKVAESTFVPADPTTGLPGYTVITLDEPVGPASAVPAQAPTVYRLRQRTNLFGFNAPDWQILPLPLRIGELDPHFQLGESLIGFNQLRQAPQQGTGAMVPSKASDDFFLTGPYADRRLDWAEKPFGVTEEFIYLDQVYDGFVAGSWLVMRRAGFTAPETEAYEVLEAVEVTKTDFTLSNKVTRLKIRGRNINMFSPRNATVFGVSEPHDWGLAPLAGAVTGTSVVLAAPVDGLEPERRAAVTGIDTGSGEPVAQILTVLRSEAVIGKGDAAALGKDAATTKVHFTSRLDRPLRPETLRINANVVSATHGETREVVVGSGDAARPFQAMVLPDAPLTFVSATTPSGSASTLEVRVDDVLWTEVASFKGRAADERIYTTRLADDGTVTIRFGDGITGTRLPTGQNNVSVRYRVGIGLVGQVRADTLTQLQTRPLGLQMANNPRAATGAEDPEAMASAKRNAPQSLRTMDRIVSVTDYQDFALAFGGIGNARAAALWSDGEELVYITVAGADGTVITPADDIFINLAAAIDTARHPDRAVRLAGYSPVSFALEARITIDPAYLADVMLGAVGEKLLESFSFDQRGFAQPVAASDVIVAMQQVEGVVAVDLEKLYRLGEAAVLNALLPALPERVEGGAVLPAELMTIDPDGITLLEDDR